MKCRITFEADDRLRRAINQYYGDEGKADYARVKNWFEMYGESANDDLLTELDEHDQDE